jgi:PAS domain S-box-containing protein
MSPGHFTPDSTLRNAGQRAIPRVDDILENISDAFIALDRDWRITFCNSATLRLVAPLHPSASELIGHNLWDKFPDIVDAPIGQLYRECMASQHSGSMELHYEPLHRWLEARVFPTEFGLAIYVCDISERKVRESRLAELSKKTADNARLFDAILSNIPDLAYAFDRDIRFLYANKPLLTILGRTLAEVVGKNCLELGYPPELAARLEGEMREVLATGRPFQGETPLVNASGQTDHHEYIYSPAFGEDGKVAAIVGTTRLVTARKHAELIAERQRDILQLTARGAPLSRVLEEIARALEFEIHHRGFASILLADNAAARLRSGAAPSLPPAYTQAIDGLPIAPSSGSCGTAAWSRQPVFSVDIENDPCWRRFKDLALSYQLRACWSLPILSGDGELLGTFAIYLSDPRHPSPEELRILENTTRVAAIAIERERSEDAVRASESQLRLVTDHASVLLAHMDRAYRYKFVNRPYATRYGRTPAETVDKHAVEVVGQALFDRARPYIDRALAGEEIEFELDTTLPGQELRWSNVVYTPERTSAGEVIGLVAVHTDITLRKQAELDATRARDEALRAGQAKDEFLAALSHELRTPLNPVLLLASESAGNETLPPAIREDFNTIAKNVQLEARLIDDLLDLTRITRGKMSLDIRPVDLHVVLQDAITTLQPEISARDLTLALTLSAPFSTVEGDPIRLQQVFWNILRNAVKFTSAGGEVKITSRLNKGTGHLCIEISDSGIGMTPAELAKVFEAFAQGDHAGSPGSHRFGGLGLGLSISRKIVELHSGTIEASSPGREQGATFTVHLPLSSKTPRAVASSGSRAPVECPPSPAGRRRILLIEDHEPTRKALTQLLTRRKYEVVPAGTVAEALAAAASNTFDLVISDIGLPDGNGHQLMACLRDRYGLPGIALSGYGMDHDVAQGRACGFLAHLIKPVDVQSLENALVSIPRK